jgi:hypothetical protein
LAEIREVLGQVPGFWSFGFRAISGRNGLIPAYQAHQLVAMIRRYGEDA